MVWNDGERFKGGEGLVIDLNAGYGAAAVICARIFPHGQVMGIIIEIPKDRRGLRQR